MLERKVAKEKGNQQQRFQKEHERTNINGIRVATINVRTLQDDIKLATVIKAASTLEIDVLALQEVRRAVFGYAIFDDDSIKGWQFIWSGYKRKAEHGVGIL